MSQLEQLELKTVLSKIEEIVLASAAGEFLFRGENEIFEHVSSGLYRKFRINRADTTGIEVFQDKIIKEARRFTFEKDDDEILAQLQHFESGLTNLIDFTTDYLIALFFACDGSPDSDGRIIFLRKENANTFIASGPGNRLVAQKSIFVRPATGVVEPDLQVIIPASLKRNALKYLDAFHGISPEGIYNDLHGFIRHWTIDKQASNAYFSGIDQTIEGNYELAITHFSESLYFLPDYPVLFERGCAYLEIGEWEKAIEDFSKVVWPALGDGNAFLSAAAFNGLGIARRHQEKYLEAAEDFRSAMAYYSLIYQHTYPEDQDEALERATEMTASNLIAAYMEIGDMQSALEYAKRACEQGHDPGFRYREDYNDETHFELTTGYCVPEELNILLLRDSIEISFDDR